MILGLAMHGRGEDALSLFAGMQRAGVTPNEVTLLGVLTACCHAGLVEEGLQQLDTMRRNEIDKVPGCSLIEIDGVVHEFKAIPANSIR
uniref:Pentatricopeptide repeat-containing protein n=2 Tax=Oryza TaxID=4527 RepID=A0A0D3HBS9_9ORYZ